MLYRSPPLYTGDPHLQYNSNVHLLSTQASANSLEQFTFKFPAITKISGNGKYVACMSHSQTHLFRHPADLELGANGQPRGGESELKIALSSKKLLAMEDQQTLATLTTDEMDWIAIITVRK